MRGIIKIYKNIKKNFKKNKDIMNFNDFIVYSICIFKF